MSDGRRVMLAAELFPAVRGLAGPPGAAVAAPAPPCPRSGAPDPPGAAAPGPEGPMPVLAWHLAVP